MSSARRAPRRSARCSRRSRAAPRCCWCSEARGLPRARRACVPPSWQRPSAARVPWYVRPCAPPPSDWRCRAAAPPCRRESRTRKRPRRGRGARLALERMLGGGAASRIGRTVAAAPTRQIAFGFAPRLIGSAPRRRRLEGDARASGLGQPDRDRLLRRAGAVLAFADVVHFLADELACLRRWRFTLALVAPRPS